MEHVTKRLMTECEFDTQTANDLILYGFNSLTEEIRILESSFADDNICFKKQLLHQMIGLSQNMGFNIMFIILKELLEKIEMVTEEELQLYAKKIQIELNIIKNIIKGGSLFFS